jgi:D-cysteine desulfhydrase
MTNKRKELAILPSPIHKLERLTSYLNGPEIYIKRDDLTGLGLGGNKLRKLEFLIGEALEKGYDTIITGGAEQSNHCRQTAAAAAVSGLECHLVLGGSEPNVPKGNYLLDLLFGAKIHWSGDFRKGEKIPEITSELECKGKKVYKIPYGGSNAIGALGYVFAMNELKQQLETSSLKIDTIIFATSSGGTQAGMTVGKFIYGLDTEIYGIKIDKEEINNKSYKKILNDICHELLDIFKTENINFKFRVNNNYLGKGYGIVSDLEKDAIKLLAKTEGIIVDPVYTGRAFGGMIDLINRNEFTKGQNILFWHTGGIPSLYSYSDILV